MDLQRNMPKGVLASNLTSSVEAVRRDGRRATVLGRVGSSNNSPQLAEASRASIRVSIWASFTCSTSSPGSRRHAPSLQTALSAKSICSGTFQEHDRNEARSPSETLAIKVSCPGLRVALRAAAPCRRNGISHSTVRVRLSSSYRRSTFDRWYL